MLSFWLASAVLAALQSRARATSGRATPFVYWANCTDLSYELVQALTARSRPITYATFARNVDLDELRAQGHPAMYRISAPGNWTVTFSKAQLPSGRPVYYFTWSGIEHVFVDPNDPPDRQLEIALGTSAMRQLQGHLPSSPAGLRDRVYAELIARGGDLDEERHGVLGPSPLKHVILSDQTDGNGDPVLWVHWIEADEPGAIRFLLELVHDLEPFAILAGEAGADAWGAWEHLGAEEIDIEDAEAIYPHLDEDNRFFLISSA